MERFKENMVAALGKMDFLVTVPTSGINEVYAHFENENKCLYVTREEEGVALASGLALSGKKVAMLIQQSGVGNMLNAVFTLSDPYAIHFPIIVMVRGEQDENPIHWLSTRNTVAMLNMLSAAKIDWAVPGSIEAFEELTNENKRWIISNY